MSRYQFLTSKFKPVQITLRDVFFVFHAFLCQRFEFFEWSEIFIFAIEVRISLILHEGIKIFKNDESFYLKIEKSWKSRLYHVSFLKIKKFYEIHKHI